MYAGTAIYEIHACSAQGQWQIAATFDDPNAAVAEAVRLRGSQRYIGIRVTEVFHDAVDEFATRVIYRYTTDRDRHGVTATQPEAMVAGSRFPKQVFGDEPPTTGTSLTRRETKSAGWSLGRFLPMHLSVVIAAALLVLTTIGAA
jgi:hypothetical protein